MMQRCQTLLFATALAFAFAAPVTAAGPTPVGTWTTIDDVTGKPKSVVQINETNGELSGTVLQVLQPDQGPDPLCEECRGELKDKPVVGMRILWGMKRDGDAWQGGKILDPDSGKTYRCNMHLTDAGQKLEVRGFLGFSVFGRTQVWNRRTTP